MKFAVIGCGSIGKRHIETIGELGHEVVAYNRGEERRRIVAKRFGIETFSDFERIFKTRPDAAIICTPNSLHLTYAIAAARRGVHLFIEKPVSHSMEGLDELCREVKSRGLITHVGSNMRFHVGPEKVWKGVSEGQIGKPLWAYFWGGMHLPNWHPDEDYRQMYSAKESLGGGALLDFIHELDLILWMFGEPEGLVSVLRRTGWLEIETEDLVDAILMYPNSFQVAVHLDYLQKPFQRGIRIVGTDGWIEWDLAHKGVMTHDYSRGETASEPHPEQWEHQSMYSRQMEYFVSCLLRKTQSMSSLESGIKALRLALNLKRSSMEQKFIRNDEQCKFP